jgi:hypothetical protein
VGAGQVEEGFFLGEGEGLVLVDLGG